MQVYRKTARKAAFPWSKNLSLQHQGFAALLSWGAATLFQAEKQRVFRSCSLAKPPVPLRLLPSVAQSC